MTYEERELLADLVRAGIYVVRNPVVTPSRNWRDHIPLVPHLNKLHQIAQIVALRTGVRLADLVSPRRHVEMVRARHIFFALAYALTGKSTLQIGYYCGGRDHSTVIHGLRKVMNNRHLFEPEITEILGAFPECEGIAKL